jgi:glutamate synthase (NADPH) small chain
MGELGGFLKRPKLPMAYDDPRARIEGDDAWREFIARRPDEELRAQGARCMECGIPFCHNGCPVGNLIPDWNDLVFGDRWQDAIRQLHATNNFPEFTGKLCPAPCEAACTLEINEGDAVTIKQIEEAIAARAWDEGWVVPEPPRSETGRSVAVVGAGPAGMAAAQQLRRSGHRVVLFERDEEAGGLVRFGVPDFKIEKWVVARRVQQLLDEGVELRCGVDVGVDITADELRAQFDAVVLAIGSRVPRDLPVPGREHDGVHFAMDYLYERTRRIRDADGAPGAITAQGKHVVVIGGGDTGADCVASSLREGAASITQLELLPEPPAHRPDDRTPWPLWPQKFRLSYAMEEARATGRGVQTFSIVTTHLSGDDEGRVAQLHYARAEDRPPFGAVAGTEKAMAAELVLLAMGFVHPEHEGLVRQLQCELDARGNLRASTYATSVDGVFAAGDARRGQSLIVWAINEGRQCARMVDRYLGAREPAPALVGAHGPSAPLPPQVAKPSV